MNRDVRLRTFLTIADVADRLSVNARTVRRWIDSGALRSHRLGAAVRIAEEDAAAFVAAHRR